MRRVERLVEDKLHDTLQDRVSRWQAGFRKRRSTRQQILFLKQRIAVALRVRSRATGKLVPAYPVAFIDISRAFDSVPHQYLLLKLWRAGVRGDLLHFFRAFLTD